MAGITQATGLHHIIAGAWIGGSINNTGNVVASARILDPEIEDPNAIFTAEGVAAIVKMLQNAAIGPSMPALRAVFGYPPEH